METRSYRPIAEATVDVVVVEVEAMVVEMTITTNKIGRIRLSMGVAESPSQMGLPEAKLRRKRWI